MKVKILENNEIKEIELPLECDYECIVKDGVIVGLKLPIESDTIITTKYIPRIIINQSKYTNLVNTMKMELGDTI